MHAVYTLSTCYHEDAHGILLSVCTKIARLWGLWGSPLHHHLKSGLEIPRDGTWQRENRRWFSRPCFTSKLRLAIHVLFQHLRQVTWEGFNHPGLLKCSRHMEIAWFSHEKRWDVRMFIPLKISCNGVCRYGSIAKECRSISIIHLSVSRTLAQYDHVGSINLSSSILFRSEQRNARPL